MIKPLKPPAKAVPDPGWLTFLKEFWKGFTDLSALSLAVCAALFVASIAFGLYLFSPKAMQTSLGDYIPRSAQDAAAFVTVEAIRLGTRDATNARLLLLGSSTIAQAFGPARTLHDELEAGTGLKWDIHVLTTPLQSPLDQLSILQQALSGQDEGDPPVVVVVGAGIPRVSWTAERQIKTARTARLALRSDWADQELTRLGGTPAPQSSFFVIENREFVLLNGMKSMVRLLTGSPARRTIDVYAERRTKPGRAAMLTNRTIDNADNLPFFLEQQARIASLVTAIPNTTLVMIDEPFLPDPALQQEFDAVNTSFKDEMVALAASQPLHFWPVIAEANLDSTHYHDPLHIAKGDAQTLCQTTLANRLSQLSQAAGLTDG